MGEGGQRYKLPVISSGDITSSVVTVVNNTGLHI